MFYHNDIFTFFMISFSVAFTQQVPSERMRNSSVSLSLQGEFITVKSGKNNYYVHFQHKTL